MSRPHAIDQMLPAEEMEELRAWMRARYRRVDDLYEWVLLKGYPVSRAACGNWHRRWHAEAAADRMSVSGELARAMREAVSGGEFEDVAQAATMQLTQVVFEQASRLQADEQLDPLDVQRMTASLANLVGGRAKILHLLAAKFDAAVRQQSQSAAKPLDAEAIGQVRLAMFGDAGGAR